MIGLDVIHPFFTSLSGSSFLLAFSGGLDSHVLLHWCVKNGIHVRAIHINHQLSPNASKWEAHCRAVCAEAHIPFTSININAKAPMGESPEAFARDKRYEILRQEMQPNEVLLTAHHQDDQGETLLVQLFRGSGLKGLAAMPKVKKFGLGIHARPLLTISRTELKSYAEHHQLIWIEDESNADSKFTRNFIRHEVLPLLKKRWPSMTETLVRTAEHCAEADELLSERASEDLVKISDGFRLTVSGLRTLSLARQKLALRTWILQSGFLVPETRKLNSILNNCLEAKSDRTPHIHWENVEVRRYRDALYIMPRMVPHNAQQVYEWDLSESLAVPGIGSMQKKSVLGQGLRAQLTKLTVRFRQGGEYCWVRNQHRKLKKLFQEWGVPTWLRERMPLLYIEDELVSIPGWYVHEKYAAGVDEEGYLIQLLFIE